MPFARKELIGDIKVNVIDGPVDSVAIARAVADAKTREGTDDAFNVINLDALYDRFLLWKKELPNVEPFYAVKCNSDQAIVQALASLGVGFDCASKEEIDLAIRAGAPPEKILYAHPCKSRPYIMHAESLGVNMMTFDSAEELEKLAKYHKSPELILRIAASDPTALCVLTRKFGAEVSKAAPALLKRAAVLGLNVVGVSFHVGSGSNDASAFRVALQNARSLFDIGLSLGHKMHIVDVGGGFPGGEHHIPFEQYAAIIRSVVSELFPEPGTRVIAEPGRFFAARTVSLVVNVVSHSSVPADQITGNADDENSLGHMYYINDGMFGSFNCIVFDHVNPVGRPLVDKEGDLFPSTIWGPTCDSVDKIEDKKPMRKLEVGEWLIYEEMGAYTFSASSTFNGFPRPIPIHFIGESTWNKLGL